MQHSSALQAESFSITRTFPCLMHVVFGSSLKQRLRCTHIHRLPELTPSMTLVRPDISQRCIPLMSTTNADASKLHELSRESLMQIQPKPLVRALAYQISSALSNQLMPVMPSHAGDAVPCSIGPGTMLSGTVRQVLGSQIENQRSPVTIHSHDVSPFKT